MGTARWLWEPTGGLTWCFCYLVSRKQNVLNIVGELFGNPRSHDCRALLGKRQE